MACQFALQVLICDVVLPRNRVFHPLHVIILILHKGRHPRVQVLDLFFTRIEVPNHPLVILVEIFQLRAVF